MAPCHEFTTRFAFTRAITAGSPQITQCLFNETGGALEKFERPLLHGGGHALRVARTSARDLAQATIRAAKANGQHEKRIGQADPNWPAWYAEYMVREQSGEELPL